MLPKSLIFVRHAQSTGNIMTQDQRAECDIPNQEFPLTGRGRLEARYAGLYLKTLFGDQLPDLFFQSTFLRAQQTMDIVRQFGGCYTDTPTVTDSRLDEKWDGIFHSLSKAQIESQYPEQIRLREKHGYYHYRAPGGESCPDVELRIRSFLMDLFATDKTVLIAGHGRWFRIFQKIHHELSIAQFLKLKKVELGNCAIVHYDFSVNAQSESLPQVIIPWEGQLPEESTEFA